MSVIRSTVLSAAKGIAQDPSGAALLLATTDYDLALEQALDLFQIDRPNQRVFHYTVLVSGFRFTLVGGPSPILPTSGLDRWIRGASALTDVFPTYNVAAQDNLALDRNFWKVTRQPGIAEPLQVPDAPVVSLAGLGQGNLENGVHQYGLTWVDATGETTPSVVGIVTIADKTIDGQASLTLPSLIPGASRAKLYRTQANLIALKLLATLTAADLSKPYIDNVADASLGAAVPVTNTTSVILGPAYVLELTNLSPSVAQAGALLRLEYQSPHVVDVDDPLQTSVLEGDVTAFETLCAAKICEAAARRYAQNTGTSTFQSDSVDRRTQSDVMAKRASDLMKQYRELVGQGDAADGLVIPASAIAQMRPPTEHRRGRLWH